MYHSPDRTNRPGDAQVRRGATGSYHDQRIVAPGLVRAGRPRAIGFVANHASRVGPADDCFRDCIGAAWQPLTVAPMLRPRRAMCVRRRLLPVIRAKVGKHRIARPRLMLCLWKQHCCTSTPTSSCTNSRTAPAMQRSRARRRDECWSSDPKAWSGPIGRWSAAALSAKGHATGLPNEASPASIPRVASLRSAPAEQKSSTGQPVGVADVVRSSTNFRRRRGFCLHAVGRLLTTPSTANTARLQTLRLVAKRSREAR